MNTTLTRLAAIGFIVVLAAGCRSTPARTPSSPLAGHSREAVIEAAHWVLTHRFGYFRSVDREAGRLITSPITVGPTRFFADVRVTGEAPPVLDVEIITEVMGFDDDDLIVVWKPVERNESTQKTEGLVVEEITARLENREPNLPNLDDLEPPAEALPEPPGAGSGSGGADQRS